MQPAGARRQGQGGRRDPHALVPSSPRQRFKFAAGLSKTSDLEPVDVLIKAYQLYTEQISSCELEPQLSITRAWRLVRFMENNMLAMTKCSRCGGHFVTEPYENAKHYVCGLCVPPARAGKGAAAGGIDRKSVV